MRDVIFFLSRCIDRTSSAESRDLESSIRSIA